MEEQRPAARLSVPGAHGGSVGRWARLGAPRRAVGRPVHSWAGRRALRAPSSSSWLRGRRGAPELGEEPGPAAAALHSLAFCAATLPGPFGEPRRPRSRSGPLPRESLRLRIGPPVETAHTAVWLGKLSRSGDLGQLRP